MSVSNEVLLDVQGLEKAYGGNQVLNGITTQIRRGEVVAIIGPSGCGKSTLLNIIGGLDRQNSGDIIFEKNDNKIGYMFQNDCLFPWLTILDNCLIGLKIKKSLNKENIDYVKSLLIKYGLGEFIDSYPNNLSGGMRQRVALIRTLAIKPDLLLLDEPFSALDYQTRLAVSDDVWKIIKNEKKTTIMITHDVAEAISMADRVIVLSDRPAKVKKIYTIDMEDKGNPTHNRNLKEFRFFYNDIWKDIDIHV